MQNDSQGARSRALPAGDRVDFARPELRRYAMLFGLCLLAFALKSPDALSSPQFWAEDGAIFFQQQQGRFWPPGLTPYAGYLHTLPRLIAWLASFPTPQWAPLVYNVGAWVINASAIAFVLYAIQDARLRVIAFLALFLAPTNGEVFGSLTNVQWHVQFFLVAICFLPIRAPSRGWAIAASAATLLAGLTGPFSVLLAAAHVAFWVAGRVFPQQLGDLAPSFTGSRRPQLFALYLAAIIQVGYIAGSDNGNTAHSFATMLASIGQWTQGHLFGKPVLPTKLFLAGFAVLGLATLCLRRNTADKGFVLALATVAVLEILLASGKQDVVGLDLGYGDRYFVAFKLAFWLALAMCAYEWAPRRETYFLVASALVLVALLNPGRMARAPLEHKAWRETLDAAPPGEAITVPINPTPWAIVVQPRD